MRTRKNARNLLMAAMLCLSEHVLAQCDVTNHNGGPLYYLGWNALANQVLEVKNEANKPIDFYTDNIWRSRLLPTQSYTIGSFTNQVKDGHMLLHLVDDVGLVNPLVYAQQHDFRPWQRNGITFTGKTDHV
mgnify:CR=1 FL=1